jgi:uncharacterized membrane protein
MKRRLIRMLLSDNRLMRLIPFGYRLTQSFPFGYRLTQSIPFGYRRRMTRGMGNNPILPVIGGIGLGSVMMALLDPVAGKRRRANVRDGIAYALENTSGTFGRRSVPFGYWLTRSIPFGYLRRTPRETGINQVLPVIGGIGLGGLVMALLDPVAGRRRRDRVRDEITHALDTSGLGERTRGLAAQAISVIKKDTPDKALAARVRSRLSRIVSHPRAIEVYVDQGRVTLAGAVLSREVGRLLDYVRNVRGVHTVDNRLESHDHPDVPSLQDGNMREGLRFDHGDWSPATRLLSSLAGGALMAYGIRRRGLAGAALGMMGAGLITRGATNKGLKSLIGMAEGSRAFEFQKTINIQAPVDAVYAFCNDLANFPRFLSRVREVVSKGNGITHWVVEGPAGGSVEWDAEITRSLPNRTLAWKSLPDMMVDNAGLIRFDSNPDGSTRVDIRLSYNPPMDAAGHPAAARFGSDPESEMEADLLRMKNLIEAANQPRAVAQKDKR